MKNDIYHSKAKFPLELVDKDITTKLFCSSYSTLILEEKFHLLLDKCKPSGSNLILYPLKLPLVAEDSLNSILKDR